MGERRLCLLHLYARCVLVRVQLRSLALNRDELVFLTMLSLGLHARRAARGRHHRAPPHPALPAAPHPHARALRRLLRRVQLRCRGHSRPASGPACRATRRSRPGSPLRLQRLVHFGTPANEERRPLRVSRITIAAKEPFESARATRPVRLPNAHIVRVYLQPLEFLQLQRKFCPKFAFYSFMSADAGADAPTTQQSSFASCESVALDMGAYLRSREALLRWSMPDTKALAH